jgi:hypothetical protein
MPDPEIAASHVDVFAGIEEEFGHLGDDLPGVFGRERHDNAPMGSVLRGGGGGKQAGDDEQGAQSIHVDAPWRPVRDSPGIACFEMICEEWAGGILRAAELAVNRAD